MKYKILFICLLSLIICSCNERTTNTPTTSSETDVSTFRFVAQDSFPSIGNATFTISHYAAADTGLITNIDSMTYGTPVHHLVPRLTFKATPASAVIITADSTIVLSGGDTIDFTSPVLLCITSSDLTNVKYYKIEVNVHKVDPALFNWERLHAGVISNTHSATQAFVLNDAFCLLSNDGFANRAYRSLDGKSWDGGATPNGLPANCRVREILVVDTTFSEQSPNKLYYCQDGYVYTSYDMLEWYAKDYSSETYVPEVMLMSFNDSVWAVSRHRTADTYHLSVETAAGWQTYSDPLPANWPISDFAITVFHSSSMRARAMVVGGYDTEGNGLNSRWNIEYSPTGGYRYANFAIERPLCSAIIGGTIVYYGNTFYLFGGTDADAEYVSNTALYSIDEGLNWYPIDTIHNRLMDVYTPRTQTSAFVHSNYIYLSGGQSRTETYSDMIRGRLNSIDWE